MHVHDVKTPINSAFVIVALARNAATGPTFPFTCSAASGALRPGTPGTPGTAGTPGAAGTAGTLSTE